MAKARFTVTAALVAAAALLAPQAASADRAASKQISAKRGGVVKTPRGAKLYVPAGVLRHNARATITPLPGGRYDIHIAGAWFGPVRVTVPLRGRRDRVMHQVDEVWVAEGRAGQRTVWTSQLSLFGSLETMKKVLGALRACAFSPGAQLITCLINQGFKEVEGRLYSFLASKIPNKCWAALVEASLGAGAKSGAIILSVAWTAWLKPGSPCIGRASAPAPPPSNPQPSPPAPAPVAAPAPSTPPTPGAPPAAAPPPAPQTWAEQQGSLGANTFTNPYNASGMGVKIAPWQWVQVSCKVLAPQIASANPDGYWYRIASAPWNNAYYAVANTFWNGDVPGVKPYTHFTDWAVPNC